MSSSVSASCYGCVIKNDEIPEASAVRRADNSLQPEKGTRTKNIPGILPAKL